MGSVLELLVVLLAAFGLVCLAWLVFGKLVLPVGQEGTRTVAAAGWSIRYPVCCGCAGPVCGEGRW